MSSRTATVITSDQGEWIPLPVVRWLRSSQGVDRVDQLVLPPATWEALPAGATARAVLRQRLAASIRAVWPEVLVVAGHAGSGAAGGAVWEERDRVRQVVRLVRNWFAGPRVVPFWIGDAWSTGVVPEEEVAAWGGPG